MSEPEKVFLQIQDAEKFATRNDKSDAVYIHSSEVNRLRSMIVNMGGDPSRKNLEPVVKHVCKKCGVTRQSLLDYEMHLHFAKHKPRGYKFKKYEPNRKTAEGKAIGLTRAEQEELLNAQLRGGV